MGWGISRVGAWLGERDALGVMGTRGGGCDDGEEAAIWWFSSHDKEAGADPVTPFFVRSSAIQ